MSGQRREPPSQSRRAVRRLALRLSGCVPRAAAKSGNQLTIIQRILGVRCLSAFPAWVRRLASVARGFERIKPRGQGLDLRCFIGVRGAQIVVACLSEAWSVLVCLARFISCFSFPTCIGDIIIIVPPDAGPIACWRIRQKRSRRKYSPCTTNCHSCSGNFGYSSTMN